MQFSKVLERLGKALDTAKRKIDKILNSIGFKALMSSLTTT
jgi:hypothetical protein